MGTTGDGYWLLRVIGEARQDAELHTLRAVWPFKMKTCMKFIFQGCFSCARILVSPIPLVGYQREVDELLDRAGCMEDSATIGICGC